MRLVLIFQNHSLGFSQLHQSVQARMTIVLGLETTIDQINLLPYGYKLRTKISQSTLALFPLFSF